MRVSKDQYERLLSKVEYLEREYRYVIGTVNGFSSARSTEIGHLERRLNVHQSMIDTMLIHLQLVDDDEQE